MSDPTIADACIPLLRGVVYADTQPAAWNALLALPAQVRDYLSTIGLDVVIDEAGGVCLSAERRNSPEQDDPPRLIARRR